MTIFLLRLKLYPANWYAKFTFEAATPDEAEKKALGWARYHNFDGGSVIVEEIFPEHEHYEELLDWLHNEFVEGL